MASAAPAPKPGVLLLRRTDADFAAALRARFRVHDLHASGAPLGAFLATAAAEPEPPRAALVMAGGDVLVDAAFLDAVPSLGCVVTTSAGVDHVDLAQCARRGVAVAGAGEAFSVDVADHAVGLLVAVLRRVAAADRYVRAGLWPAQGDYPLTTKLKTIYPSAQRQARRHPRAGQRRLAGRQAPPGIRLRRVLPLEGAQGLRRLPLLPRRPRARRGLRRPGRRVRAKRRHAARRRAPRAGRAGPRRRPGERRARGGRGRAGAGRGAAGREDRRRGSRRLPGRAAPASRAGRHGQCRPDGAPGGVHRGV
uniref:D-isomer specific 2-hydroxyacid dehydrogenase catalytic domain-containing protein n=2 Tax=Zea mays TaxID=4577 RepID=A0A804QLB4_MAIZE